MKTYDEFLRSKTPSIETDGFQVTDAEISAVLKPHQRDIVKWALMRGRSLIAASFGLGKTLIQAEMARLVYLNTGKPFLVVAPLSVKHQFIYEDGPRLGQTWVYVRNMAEYAEAIKTTPYVVTNYERIREGNLDIPAMDLGGASLDEGSVLRSLGSDTQQVFEDVFQDVHHRWVATATPAPNSYLELLNYAQFLGVEKRSNLLTKYFKRNPDQAGDLRLMPSMERNFWLWLAGWALFVYRPSDLGHDDTGYILPELKVRWHRVQVDQTRAFEQLDRVENIKIGGKVYKAGQRRMFLDAGGGVSAAAEERRETLQERLDKAKEIMAENPDAHYLLWHNLENERHAIEKQIPAAVTVYGSQDLEEREQAILDFSHGKIQILATKPEIAGSGCNFQYYCSDAIFMSVDYKFQDFIQAVHRIYRFLQDKTVNVHIIYAESQQNIVDVLKRKWEEHKVLVENMRQIIKQYGLIHEALGKGLQMSIGVEREETKSNRFTMIYNDAVLEAQTMATDSVDMILTSIPFSKHYSYVPEQGAYNDMGHNISDDGFFEQMDYLIPDLYRILKPGRICAVHTKPLIHYGHATQSGFMEIYPFHHETCRAFLKHGFMLLGEIISLTDVVRENNSTYRLGWTEATEGDMTKMGQGLPEYIYTFRKPPSDTSTSRADEPVRHTKDDYSRARWQLDAHALWRSDGNRLQNQDELYNFAAHVQRLRNLEDDGRLSASFLMEPPKSNNPFVWDDINLMRTLNTMQAGKRREKHICPFSIDQVERLISRFTNPGELIFDPFGGIGTTPYVAVKLGRRGISTELNYQYYRCAVDYCKAAEQQALAPTLFDLAQLEDKPVEDDSMFTPQQTEHGDEFADNANRIFAASLDERSA